MDGRVSHPRGSVLGASDGGVAWSGFESRSSAHPQRPALILFIALISFSVLILFFIVFIVFFIVLVVFFIVFIVFIVFFIVLIFFFIVFILFFIVLFIFFISPAFTVLVRSAAGPAIQCCRREAPSWRCRPS